MSSDFFEKPILNSPYEYPMRHWELDDQGQPTQKIIENRRTVKLVLPQSIVVEAIVTHSCGMV